MVVDLVVFLVRQVLNIKIFFSLFNTALGQDSAFCFFIDDVIGVRLHLIDLFSRTHGFLLDDVFRG